MQTKTQDSAGSVTASTFVSYLCRIFALFPHGIFTKLWALVYSSTFTIKKKKLCLELWKYIFIISNCQSFVVFWKMNYEINWQENAFYWQQNLTGLQTVLTSYEYDHLTVHWIYLYLQFSEFDIIIGTILLYTF